MLAEKFHDVKFEAGCDEAGRGCLAGSVFAAAVIFPQGYANEEIKDSKKLSAKKLMKNLFGRNTDDADRIILSERDFNI